MRGRKGYLSGGGGGDGGVAGGGAVGGGGGGVGGVGGKALGGDAELLVEGHLVAGRRARAAALEGGVVDVEPGEERAHDLVLPAAVLAAGPPHRGQLAS